MRRRHVFRPIRLSKTSLVGLIITLPIALMTAGYWLFQAQTAVAANELSVEIVAGYNLVVDSNVESPSTYAPSVATVMGRVCNTSGGPLTGVTAYIGSYPGLTPGIYPARDSSTFSGVHNHLLNTGSYAFTHVGGRAGTADASRFVGTLAAGECRVQYWHFTYPRRGNPNNTGQPVWGLTRDPNDDLWLEFDVWATGKSGVTTYTDNARWRMTMRNEISAMANKIKPNPAGRWFNTNTNQIQPGAVITSNGILYELGNINQGFDNDGDGVPDYNAWLQPIGDPSYDPSCFRLIRTSGVLTVSRSSGLPKLLIPFTEQLYFTNLPANNTGVVGEVFYTFLALNGPCSTGLTPYQEVASGSDNEKFNGDYGAGIPPVVSTASAVTLTKSSSPNQVALGGTVTYQIPFGNGGTAGAGLPLSSGGIPLVISDTIPAGTQYVGGSASATVGTGVTILYYNGSSWSTTEPAPASSVRAIQWWLNDTLAAGAAGFATFRVSVPGGYSGSPFIENEACAGFGGGMSFTCDDTATMVSGSNSIGDLVWQDTNGDGLPAGESGINNITVSLYWDRDGDGLLDDDDVLITSKVTAGGGAYTFSSLPNGNFLVVVDAADADLPAGYTPTTPIVHAVTGLGTTKTSPYLTADFGFGPSLAVDKTLISSSPALENQRVVYTIDVENLRPGNGTGQPASCVYTVWAAAQDTSHNSAKVWTNPTNAFGAGGPDGVFASATFEAGANKVLGGTSFSLGSDGGTITKVEAVFQFYVDGLLTDDWAEAQLWVAGAAGSPWSSSPSFTTAQLNAFRPAAANAGLLVWNVTSLRSWSWTDFSGTADLDLTLTGVKASAPDPRALFLDAMGLRVTTNQQCGSSDDTLNPVPLTDTYDAAKLTFVSAVPAQTSVTTGGTTPYANTGVIAWNNVGPVYAGGSKTITVTFLAKDGIAPTTHTNTAAVSGATFLDGRPANSGSDVSSHAINPTGSIGDTIWNNNGAGGGTAGNNLQDGTEQGLPGVKVDLIASTNVVYNGVTYLAGSVIQSTTTDASGKYRFTGLPNATYTVIVDNTSLPGMTANYDPDGGTAHRATTTIAAANDVTTLDFGYTIPNIIYGTVWRDFDGDGARDTGDSGIGSVSVTLYRWNGSGWTAVSTLPTASDGSYRFSGAGVPDGEYYVAVNPSTLPATPAATWANTFDPDGDLDSESSTTQGAGTITVAGGQISGAHNFGYHVQTAPYAVSGTVYGDWNTNSNFDGNNPDEGFGSVTVKLFSSTGELIATTTTNPDGSYSFGSLIPGTYQVVVDSSTLPAQFTPAETSGPVTISTASVANVDFGYRPDGSSTIGDLVWRDTDGSGAVSGSETGIGSIEVFLYSDADGDGAYTLVRTATTAGAGSYSFSNLPPGAYRVVVDSGDANLPIDANSQPFVLTTAGSVDVALSSGQTYADADFGFAGGGLIGDFIWYDNDGDGIQDIGEAGIPGVDVRLTAVTTTTIGGVTYLPGQLIRTATTNASGQYTFAGLPGGTVDYTVSVNTSTLPATVSTTPTGDPDRTFDSTAVSTLTRVGQIDRSMDFGYQPTNRIGDRVWLDLDGDGSVDPGEPGLPGVVITLTLQGGGVYTTTTDSDGYYSFGNGIVSNGTHTVEVDRSTLPAGIGTPTYDLDGSGTPHTTQVAVSSGSRLDVDFGYKYSGAFSISGTLFFDQGNDGGTYTPPGDTGFANLTVYLRDATTGIVITTTTDGSGFYQFNNLPDGGTYTVSINRQAPQLGSLSQTSEPDDLNCTDVGSACNNRTTITIAGGSVTGRDFGFYAALDCGDLPNSYKTQVADEGACHVISSIYLGGAPDAEPDGQPNATASGDGADEDGIVLDMTDRWTAGATVDLTATLSGGSGYLVGWFDWNGDGDFGDAGERVIFGTLPAGANALQLTIPGGYATGSAVSARFRLYDSAPATLAATGTVTGGEVEDYRWLFSPTAVSLQQFTLQSAANVFIPLFVTFCLLLLTVWLLRRRRQTR